MRLSHPDHPVGRSKPSPPSEHKSTFFSSSKISPSDDWRSTFTHEYLTTKTFFGSLPPGTDFGDKPDMSGTTPNDTAGEILGNDDILCVAHVDDRVESAVERDIHPQPRSRSECGSTKDAKEWTGDSCRTYEQEYTPPARSYMYRRYWPLWKESEYENALLGCTLLAPYIRSAK